jgi:CheY-like chemotaxis protein
MDNATDYAPTLPEALHPAALFPAAPATGPALAALKLEDYTREEPGRANHRANLLVVIEDTPALSPMLRPICEYLGLILRPASSAAELIDLLEDYRPLAIISPFEAEFMDGGHILKTIATQDPTLPVMLLTQQNPAFQGAVEAMVNVFGLPNVNVPAQDPTMGDLVDFLAHAARHTRIRRPRTPLNGDVPGFGQ